MILPVSVMIVVRNAAHDLGGALDSLRGFDEVIVIDSHSADNTADIARTHGARVVPYEWDGKYPKKRQWCLDHISVRNEWIFFVDADERVTTKLKSEIAAVLSGGADAFFVRGQPVFAGRKLNYGRWNNKIVLFRRGSVFYPECNDLGTPMGEIEGHYQPIVTGRVAQIAAPLVHDCADDIDAWIDRHQRYATWQAMVEQRGGIVSTERGVRRFLKRIFYRTPLRPVVAFIDSYVLKMGILDGMSGFHYATARAFFYWMVAVKRRATANTERENAP